MPRPLHGQYFRAGVGAVIARPNGHVLVLERSSLQGAWQFPQGGLDDGEEPAETVYREIQEETGLQREHLALLQQFPDPLTYELPPDKRSPKTGRGQTQYWFFLELIAPDTAIQLPHVGEFRAWKWADFDDAVASAVDFRRRVYDQLRRHFHDHVAPHLGQR
jgi:putative (di)nucleoside polyphosphate hydrolase